MGSGCPKRDLSESECPLIEEYTEQLDRLGGSGCPDTQNAPGGAGPVKIYWVRARRHLEHLEGSPPPKDPAMRYTIFVVL